jgi:hypothetical protein
MNQSQRSITKRKNKCQGCPFKLDETLQIINKPKHSKKQKGVGGDIRNKMEGPMSKKIKKPPKRVNHKGNIKFLNPLLLREAYQMRKGVNKSIQQQERFSN